MVLMRWLVGRLILVRAGGAILKSYDFWNRFGEQKFCRMCLRFDWNIEFKVETVAWDQFFLNKIKKTRTEPEKHK